MSKALQSILGHVPLTEALRTTASGVPNPFPAEFFAVESGNRVLGNQAEYIRISGERRTAKRVAYGAPAKRRSLRPLADQAVTMLHSFESFGLDMLLLQKLRSFEQFQQDKGMDYVRYQLEEAARRQQNTRIIATASVLRYGKIYFSSDGDVLASSSGADSNLTVDFGVPATHQNQINSIVTVPWSNVNADIPGDINNIQQYSLQETGMELEAVLYGINVSKYIRQNVFCTSYLSRNPQYNGQIVNTNEIPDGLFGIKKWIPVWKSFWEVDDDGTIAEIWDDDLCVFAPNVGQPDKMSWWKTYEGSFPVPRTLDVQRDPMGAINSAEIVYGQGSYAQLSLNPIGAEVYHFDTFLPALRNEKAIMQLDTTF